MSNNVPASANQADPILAEHAVEIRRLGERVVGDVIEIGARLKHCRTILREGRSWRTWLASELNLSHQSAGRFIQIHDLAQQRSNLDHLDLPVSALYLIAAPSTPEAATTAIIARAEAGEKLSVAEVRRTVDAARGRNRLAKRAETTGDAETSVDTEDREQPAKRPPRASKPPDPAAVAEVAWNTAALLNNIGPDGPGEIARKLARFEGLEDAARRLEIENVGLRSEVEELRSENAALREALDEANKKLTKLNGESVALRSELAKRVPVADGRDISASLRRAAPVIATERGSD